MKGKAAHILRADFFFPEIEKNISIDLATVLGLDVRAVDSIELAEKEWRNVLSGNKTHISRHLELSHLRLQTTS